MLSGVFERNAYKPGDYVCIHGKITNSKITDYGVGYYLHNGFYVTASEVNSEVSLGDTVMVKGKIKELKSPANDGQFDQKLYYQSIGIFYKVAANDISLVTSSGKYSRIVNYVNRRMKESFDSIAIDTDSGVLKAVVLGDKTDMDKDYYSLYQRNGIAHLLAISGLHVSFVGMALYRLMRKAGVTCIMAFGISCVFLAFYGMLTGNGVSARRAVIMCVVSMGAEVAGRMYDTLSALSLAAVILVTDNPYAVFNSGFLLSFFAILGICIMIPPVTGMLKPLLDKWCDNVYFDTPPAIKLSRKAVRWLAMALAQSAGISLFTLPVILYSFYEIPVLGVLLNVVVIPLMSVVLFTGIAGGVIALFNCQTAVFIIGSAHYILKFFQSLCSFTDKLPFNRWSVGQPQPWQIVLYYIVLVAGIYVIKGLKRKRFTGTCIWLCVLVCVIGYKQKHEFQAHMIDVGQGDGIYVSAEGLNMLYDGGSTDVSEVGRYRIYPFLKSHGITKLDYIFVSHTDKDHVSGILELIKMGDSSLKINTLVMPLAEGINEDDNYKMLCDSARDNGIRIVYADAGDFNISKENLYISCVSPHKNGKYSDINSASAVYRVEYKNFSMLMTGDMTQESEKQMADSDVRHVNCLKVAHHGSKTSSGSEFIEKLNPDIALISCGRDNKFGHPASKTIETLERSGCDIYGTDISGQISIYYDKNRYVLKTKYK